MSRGGKGDDCQGFEEFGVRPRSDEFNIKVFVPCDFTNEGTDNSESLLEVTFPEVSETTDVVESNFVLIFRLSVGHFLGLDVGDHVHGVEKFASSFGHIEA